MERTSTARRSVHDAFEHGSRERSNPAPEGGRRFRGAFARYWIPRLRPFAVAALVCVLFQVFAPWQYAEAQALPEPPRSRTGFAMPEIGERLVEAVRRTREALDQLETTSSQSFAGNAGLGQATERCSAALETLEAIDGEIQAGYELVTDHIRRAGLAAEIRARQAAAEKSYREGFRELRHEARETLRLAREQELASERGNQSQAAALGAEVGEHAARADGLLAEMVKPSPRVPLDPNNLPHRRVELEPREPRLTPEEFGEISTPAPVVDESARRAMAPVLSFAATAEPPGPEDLAETVEVQLTPQIQALADSLGRDPLAIFDFVHNEIEFTPTFGSIQGAESCLLTRRCNAFDTASLLIALYRASDIPARYALGTIEVPIDQIRGLVGGFTDARSALQLIASSGTPVTGVGSDDVPTLARMEHVWVEAFLDYIPSRGVRQVEGDTWVPLDPSFKQSDFVDPFDALGALDFDADGFLTSVLDGAQIDETVGVIQALDLEAIDGGLADLEQQIGNLAASPEAPDTARQILGGPRIEPQTLPALPGALPYRVLVRAGQLAELPASLRHRLRFEVASGFLALTPSLVHTAPLAALAGKRITLSYVPASEADEATLASFLPEGGDISVTDLPTSLPAYLIEMRPQLKIEGEVVATGGAVTLGTTGRYRLFFDGPGAPTRAVDNAITAGSYSALVLNLGRIESPEPRQPKIQSVFEELQSEDPSGVDRDDVFGELLHLAGVLYWLDVEIAERAAAGDTRVAFSRQPSEGIFAFDFRVETIFGAPRRVSPGAFVTDVDSNVFSAASLDGERERVRDFALTSGVSGSRAESVIWDALFNQTQTGRGITAMGYLEAAARRDIPIFSIDASNVATVLPQLDVSAAVARDVTNAANAGKVITIPQRAFELDGFSGVGYVVLDPETAAGGYLISSGLAGGAFTFDDALGLLFDIAFNITLTLAAEVFPAIATALLLIGIVTFLLGIVIALLNAAARIRANPNLTQGEKVAIIVGAVTQVFLSSLFLLAGGFKLSLRASLTLDVAGPLTDSAVSTTVNFIVGDSAPPGLAPPTGPVTAGLGLWKLLSGAGAGPSPGPSFPSVQSVPTG